MVDNSWAFDLGTLIYTKVKTMAMEKLKTQYPSISFTSSDLNDNSANFPTVYIHEIGGIEQGQDLENNTINAVLETMQVDIYVNTKQNDAKRIMSVVASCFKELGFSIIAMPEFQNTSTVYRSTMRVRRMIGSGDKF